MGSGCRALSVLSTLQQLSSLLLRFTQYDIDHITLLRNFGAVDEDEKGMRFFQQRRARDGGAKEKKKRLLDWVSVGIMIGGMVNHYGLKRIIQLQ